MFIEMNQRTNVSAERLWDVFGAHYPDIQSWSSGVYASRPREGVGPGGAPFEGRICETSFGKLTETVSAFDPNQRKITYLVEGEKMPGFVKRMENSWHFRKTSDGSAEVVMRLNGDLAFPFNLLIGWAMKRQLTKDLQRNIDELIHYTETGLPHPRKVQTDGSAKARKAKANFI